MRNNITVVVGDNATGKTRYLKQLREQYANDSKIVVTNFGKSVYDLDTAKYEAFKEDSTKYFNDLLDGSISDGYSVEIYPLIRLCICKGDVLLIDEIDATLERQHLIDFCATLSQLRDYWDEIIVSGYSYDIMRIFTKIEWDNDWCKHRESVYRCLYLKANGNLEEFTDEVKIDECFDLIRG